MTTRELPIDRIALFAITTILVVSRAKCNNRERASTVESAG